MKLLKCNCKSVARTFSAKHDAYFCEHCDMWLEPKCTDDACEFCVNRPQLPSEAHRGRNGNEKI